MRVFQSQTWHAYTSTKRVYRIWLLPLLAVLCMLPSSMEGDAKTPGSTYCFYGKCHRVKSIVETQSLVGQDTTLAASFYDDCKRDRYNPCGLTSSGERFHPNRADNAASPIYPDGTTILVWSPESKRAAVLRVNNAGPYWGNRKLDVSRATAEYLGFAPKGVANLQVRVIEAPTAEEAKYAKNRKYDRVPGYIGQYVSAEAALEAAKAAITATDPAKSEPKNPLIGFAAAAAALSKPAVGEAAPIAVASLDGVKAGDRPAARDAKADDIVGAPKQTATSTVTTPAAAPKTAAVRTAAATGKVKAKPRKRSVGKKKSRRKSRVALTKRKRAVKGKATKVAAKRRAVKVAAKPKSAPKPKPMVAGPPNDNAWFRKQVRSTSGVPARKNKG